MRTGKTNREDEEYEEDELVAKREGSAYTSNANSSIGNSKDAKNKANALRSKHSVTEQHRRCKINARFHILRDLIPHSDQKRDTASFLLELWNLVLSRLLNSLTRALQNTRLDLSRASISVQIDLGNRVNKSMPFGTLIFKETGNPPPGHLARAHVGDLGSGDDSDRAKKRLRT